MSPRITYNLIDLRVWVENGEGTNVERSKIAFVKRISFGMTLSEVDGRVLLLRNVFTELVAAPAKRGIIVYSTVVSLGPLERESYVPLKCAW